MSDSKIEIVVKIGSMALISKEDNDLDYNIISRLGKSLKPGMILVSSGSVEIGRLDYMKRNNNNELKGSNDDIKSDYASQGQTILMQNYRKFIAPQYSVRQLLVEHQHFNEKTKLQHIRNFLFRCQQQNAIPIINYNDPVNMDETRKMELSNFSDRKNIVECIDNDETAAVVSNTVKSKYLILLTTVNGIYKDSDNPDTLIEKISGKNTQDLINNIKQMQHYCHGASRAGANGAHAKLEYAMKAATQGTIVIIANAKYKLKDVIEGNVPRTIIGTNL